MVEQALLVARVAFVVLLYLFIWRVVKLSVRDIRAPQESLIITPEAARAAGLGAAAPPPAPAPGPAGPRHLFVVKSPVFPPGSRVVLDEDVVFGRAQGCDVVLEGDGTASGRHARVFHRNGTVLIEDLGSTNGTFVNGRRVAGDTALAVGDRVGIGGTELEVRAGAA
jgi:pSer/pThr/pTyr-binding forkhead associated (FHA) protein